MIFEGHSVLVVEDEYLVADEIVEMLEQRGARIMGPVQSPAQALDLIARETPDGAVLDINLRGESVYAVADALTAAGVPFIFVTGYDQWVLPSRYADVLRCEKPIDPAALANALVKAMLNANGDEAPHGGRNGVAGSAAAADHSAGALRRMGGSA